MDMDRPLTAERVSVGRPKPVTLITGASSGIGAELARIFAANGHEVVLAARRIPQLTAIAESIRAAGYPMPHVLPDRIPSSADALGKLAKKYQAPMSTAHTLTPTIIVIVRESGLTCIGIKSLYRTQWSRSFCEDRLRQQQGN